MDIKTIIENNEQIVKVKKRKINIENFEPEKFQKAAFAYFLKIANSIVKNKSKDKGNYDYSPVKTAINTIIAWMYTIEEFNYPKNFLNPNLPLPKDPVPDFIIDFQKGLLLRGNTGVGKTLIFKILKDFAKIDGFMEFNIVHVKKIASDFQNEGYDALEKYGKMKGLVIDDIGAEPKKSQYYGNSVNIIEELIEYRERAGVMTHGTSNVSIRENYDDRTASRATSLFNVIPLNHDKDYRLI